jgi:hypothetical protein
MTFPRVLVSAWEGGVVVFQDGKVDHELAGRVVLGAVRDADGSALAIIDHHALARRRSGAWQEIARSDSPLSCCMITRGDVFVGTEDGAHLLELERGALRKVESFDATPGRDSWVAGRALVDGKWLGPPLGVRSMSASCDGGILLANVHVGGIARSTDRGASWHPTIHVEADVHQVACHPTRPEIVAAAAAAGLCSSRDGGVTWLIENEGLHSSHCSAVAFAGDDILVAASESPFAKEGAIYRRAIDGAGPLKPSGGGLPRWTVGIVDTASIAVHGRSAAIVDNGGNLYLSEDAGLTWQKRSDGLSAPSGVLLLP